MPTVTYYKPNRTRVRTFKTCDAVRICREVLSHDETTPEELLACIAKSMGFSHISLSRPTSVQSTLVPVLLPRLVALLQALISKVLVLSKRWGWLAAIVKDLVDILDKVRKLIDEWQETTPQQAKVDDVINKDKCRCKSMLKLEKLK